VSDLPTAISAASDALLRELEVLEALEEEKRTLALDDPRIAELSARIEEIAVRILAASTIQRAITEETPEGPPIEDQPRAVAVILAEWRDAERERADASPGSAAALEADVRIRRARDEYQRAFEATRQRPGGLDGFSGS
jgi:hypothetical protein